MLFSACLLVSWFATQGPCTSPAPTLISSFPFGKQLSMGVSADNSTAFVADGASISVFDILSETVTTNVLVPDCQPLAQLHWVAPGGAKYLFMAGGRLGLWRLSFPTSGPVPEMIGESVGSYATPGQFQRKRCVALAMLDNSPPGGSPVLFALFAASSDTGKSDVGASELWAYQISGSTLPSSPVVFSFPTTTSSSPGSVGTSLAVDPANPSSVWVGMGKGGLWRADLTASGTTLSLSCTHINDPWTSSTVNYIRDIAIVNVPSLSKSFLYAALNLTDSVSTHGKVAEYDLASPTTPHLVEVGCSHPTRIAAVTKGTKVLVAVAEDHVNVLAAETPAPYWVNGFWDGVCQATGLSDGDDHGGANGTPDCRQIEFFQRDLSLGTNLALIAVAGGESASIAFGEFWGSLILRPNPGATDGYFLYACSTGSAACMYDLTWDTAHLELLPNLSSQLRFKYLGQPTISGQNPTVSLVNPEIVRFGLEGASLAGGLGVMVKISLDSTATITPIPDTGTTCPSAPFLPTDCAFDPGHPAMGDPGCKPRGANAFESDLLGEAHWKDPGLNGKEYFFPAGKLLKRVLSSVGSTGLCVCTPVDDCSTSPSWIDPCGLVQGAPLQYWSPDDLEADPLDPLMLGWRLLRLDIPSPSSGTPTGSDFHPSWRQVQAPRGAVEADDTPADDLGFSFKDLRVNTTTGWPVRVYGLRAGSTHGLKAFDAEELSTDTGCPNFQGSPGLGEKIDYTQYQQALTHIELQTNSAGQHISGCMVHEGCVQPPFDSSSRFLHNFSADTYRIFLSSGQRKYIAAVAAGFATGIQDTFVSFPCDFEAFHEAPMVVLFDVTETGTATFSEPQLMRVAVGRTGPSDVGYPGSAFAVKEKTYGSGAGATQYAFVGDLTGHLLVFDVSWSEIYPPPPANTAYLSAASPLWLAAPRLDFPKDPHDGHLPNVIQMEIQGDYLYCALARGGIGIVDIRDPTAPTLCNVLATPGLALGLTFRTFSEGETSVTQMIVGDSLCGIRVYQLN